MEQAPFQFTIRTPNWIDSISVGGDSLNLLFLKVCLSILMVVLFLKFVFTLIKENRGRLVIQLTKPMLLTFSLAALILNFVYFSFFTRHVFEDIRTFWKMDEDEKKAIIFGSFYSSFLKESMKKLEIGSSVKIASQDLWYSILAKYQTFPWLRIEDGIPDSKIRYYSTQYVLFYHGKEPLNMPVLYRFADNELIYRVKSQEK